MVRNRNNYHMQVKSLLVAFLLFLSLNLFAQPSGKPLSVEGAKGESLFKLNCASCHAMNVKLVGPALQDVHQRRSEEWLLKWIKNNEKLRASGDKDAIAVYNENGKAAMNVFENLSDDQIKSIITYFKDWTPAAKVAVVVDPAAADQGFFSDNTLYILLFLIVILTVVLLILRRTKNQLQTTLNDVEGITETEVTEPTAGALVQLGALPGRAPRGEVDVSLRGQIGRWVAHRKRLNDSSSDRQCSWCRLRCSPSGS